MGEAAAVKHLKKVISILYRGMDMRIKRQGLIVWFQHRKNLKTIKKFGNLLYVSKKLKYAVPYVDQIHMRKRWKHCLNIRLFQRWIAPIVHF